MKPTSVVSWVTFGKSLNVKHFCFLINKTAVHPGWQVAVGRGVVEPLALGLE